MLHRVTRLWLSHSQTNHISGLNRTIFVVVYRWQYLLIPCVMCWIHWLIQRISLTFQFQVSYVYINWCSCQHVNWCIGLQFEWSRLKHCLDQWVVSLDKMQYHSPSRSIIRCINTQGISGNARSLEWWLVHWNCWVLRNWQWWLGLLIGFGFTTLKNCCILWFYFTYIATYRYLHVLSKWPHVFVFFNLPLAFYVSFVVTPLCSNASELVSSLVFASKKKKENISMTFAQVKMFLFGMNQKM